MMCNNKFLKIVYISISVLGLVSCSSGSGSNGGSNNLNSAREILVLSLNVTPSPTAVRVGYSSNLIAMANYSDGTQLDVTQASTWSSSSESIAAISTAGTVTGISSGNAIITAKYHGVSGNSNVTVKPITLLNTWQTGANTINSPGIYGSQGDASSLNTPGSRGGTISWRDNKGNFWLFGGLSGGSSEVTLSRLNDLWKYDPVANQWTWVAGPSSGGTIGTYGTQGTASSLNMPGARNLAVSWKDKNGNFWLFGGLGYGESATLGRLNDLWKYDPVANQWTWVGGESTFGSIGTYGTHGINMPGARDSSSAWVDKDGNFWLFGGYGYGNSQTLGELNDLWKYDPIANQWTWVTGGNNINAIGIYGTQGVASLAHTPGARQASSVRVDNKGNFWLFGGTGFGNSPVPGQLNDLWKYNPATNEWTWITGSEGINSTGIYGTQNIVSSSNMPGARSGQAMWIDNKNNLWVFGGDGYGSSQTPGFLNDLWEYNVTTNQWTWVSGENTINSIGIYGTQGTGSSSNMPGARINLSAWVDDYNNFWLFGGWGYDSTGAHDRLNDLWQIQMQ